MEKIATQKGHSTENIVAIALEYYLDRDEPTFEESMQEALKNVAEGHVHHYASAEDLIKATSPNSHELPPIEHTPA